MQLTPRLARAPELYGDYWLNSEPVSISALRGYVVLLNFWDYSSAASLRAVPYLNEWYRKYQEYGLVVIGVHTPEFKFGKNPENVTRAIEHTGIKHTVVMDNEAIIWNAFGNRVKPTRCLIDKDGFVRFTHEGEGGYEEFEREIQVLLMDAGTRGELPQLMDPIREADRQGAVSYRQSADVAFGYLRGTMGNVEGFSPESTVEHTDPGLHLPGRFYAQGVWMDDRECIRFRGEEPGYLLAQYEALDVEGVLSMEDGKGCELLVEQDGQMLSEGNKGDDVTINKQGASVLRVDKPRLYSIVKNAEFGGHTLKLHVSRNGMEAYSLSFGTGVIPELVSNN
ncbi:MAG: redoxin domain-containing protein [Ignavibacteriae bacterium]|nr:redoxin domain-containing protein [Ignavibacteriota bacterium]